METSSTAPAAHCSAKVRCASPGIARMRPDPAPVACSVCGVSVDETDDYGCCPACQATHYIVQIAPGTPTTPSVARFGCSVDIDSGASGSADASRVTCPTCIAAHRSVH